MFFTLIYFVLHAYLIGNLEWQRNHEPLVPNAQKMDPLQNQLHRMNRQNLDCLWMPTMLLLDFRFRRKSDWEYLQSLSYPPLLSLLDLLPRYEIMCIIFIGAHHVMCKHHISSFEISRYFPLTFGSKYILSKSLWYHTISPEKTKWNH